MAIEKVNSILRAVNILECFAEDHEEWGIIELSEKVKLPQSTTYRLVNTLVENGYIKQVHESKKYKTGNRLIWLANAIISKHDIKSIAWTYLKELSKETEETVHLSGMDGLEVFYIDKIETLKSIKCDSRRGARRVAHTSGVGKVLLANQSEEFIDYYCGELPSMELPTKHSISDADVLRQQLDQIKRSGYAIDNEEAEDFLMCLAAPVYDAKSKVAAAISISGPKFRMEENIESFKPIIQRIAADISNELKSLGYED